MFFNNKKYIFIALGLIFAAVIGSIFIGNNKNEVFPAINAVPEKASVIFETDNLPYFINSLDKDAGLFQTLEESKLFKMSYSELKFIDSTFKNNDDIKDFIRNKKVIVSSHIINNNENATILITPYQKKDVEILKKIIGKLAQNKVIIQKSKYDKAEINSLQFQENNKDKIYFSFYDGYFIISASDLLLQNAIRKIDSNYGLSKDKNFKSLYGYTKSDSNSKLFINYEYFLQAANKIFNDNAKKQFEFLNYFAAWSGFDITISKGKIELSGYTVSNSEAQYLNIFKKLEPEQTQLLSVFPKKTSSFLTLNIKNGNYFNAMYEIYMADIKKLKKYTEQINTHNKTFGLNPKRYNFYGNLANEIAICAEDINKNGLSHNYFMFIKVKNIDFYKDYFEIMNNNWSKNKKIDPSKSIYNFVLNDDKYTITKVHNNKMPVLFFGDMFKFVDSEYVSFIDDYMVFAESLSALKELIAAHKNGQSFKSQSDDYNFVNSLTDESNIFFYTNIFHSNGIIAKYLNQSHAQQFNDDKKTTASIHGPVIQFIADSYPIYTAVSFTLENTPPDISETLWETKLDTAVTASPFIVRNHNTEEKEIFVQDKKNKIYLIDKNGAILWERQLSDKIISDVCQIDFYKNNKLQLIFNTKNEIHAIDRNGNYLENYPVKLKSPATNGISVIDYDFNKDYRIFIACENKKMYLYSIEGKLVDGWKFGNTKAVVKGSVQHFKNLGKDYIVFTDNQKLYITDRQGTIRIKPIADFPVADNTQIFFDKREDPKLSRFVTTNPQGIVYFTYLDGSVKKMTIANYSSEHYFLFEDLDGDSNQEFIFTDNKQTEAYNFKKERLFTYTYSAPVKEAPTIYKFSDINIKIGTHTENNKIYLINSDGTIFKGFPLNGNSIFRISRMTENPEFSLIVAGRSNFLFKYQVF